MIAATAALAACGGDDDARSEQAPTSTSSAPVATSPSTPDTTVATTMSDVIALDTTVPGTSAPGTTEAVADPWCIRAGAVREAGDRFDEVTTDPAAVEVAVTDLLDSLTALNDVAPDELAAAVGTSVEFVVRLDRALADVDYDVLTADLAILDIMGADMDAASERIRLFNDEHCGFADDDLAETDPDPSAPDTSAPDTPDPDADGPDFDFGAGSFRDQFIGRLVDDGFTLAEAACLFGEIDFTDPDSYTGDEAVTALFVTCGIDVDRIDELTVPEDGS